MEGEYIADDELLRRAIVREEVARLPRLDGRHHDSIDELAKTW